METTHTHKVGLFVFFFSETAYFKIKYASDVLFVVAAVICDLIEVTPAAPDILCD